MFCYSWDYLFMNKYPLYSVSKKKIINQSLKKIFHTACGYVNKLSTLWKDRKCVYVTFLKFPKAVFSPTFQITSKLKIRKLNEQFLNNNDLLE